MTSPTAQLRMAASELTAIVRINGVQTIHDGSAFPDDNWLIPIEIEANQTHTLNISWYLNEHLLVEEQGTFFADPANPVINPSLDFLSSGYPRFDSDCDGISNIQEVIDATDLGVAREGADNACTNSSESIVLDINSVTFPGIFKGTFPFVQNNINEAPAFYTQRVQVRRINSERRSLYSAGLGTPTLPTGATWAYVSVRYAPEGKTAVFQINNSIDYELPLASETSCALFNQDKGYRCSTPFDWNEQHWYEFQIELLEPTRLQGRIIDTQTGDVLQLGTITTEDTPWDKTALGVSYQEVITNGDCLAGLEPISMSFPVGTVNEQPMFNMANAIPNACLKGGGGWNDSIRRTADGFLRSITVGRLQ